MNNLSAFFLRHFQRSSCLICTSIVFVLAIVVGNAVAMPLGDGNVAGDKVENDKSNRVFLVSTSDAAEFFRQCLLYYKGEGVPQDYVKAMSSCEAASLGSNGGAIFYIGLMFENGQGVARDEAQAIKRYGLAAVLYNNIDAQKRIQFLAEQGNARAQGQLATMYRNGKGVKIDLIQSHYWYRQAAIQGDSSSMFNLGTIYAQGYGVPMNLKVAYVWFKISYELGEWSSLSVEVTAKRLTEEELAQAEKLATICKASHFKDCP